MSSHPICDDDTPDPWVVPAGPGLGYYMTCTLGNRVEIWHSPVLDNFRGARKTVAWQPAPGSPWSADVWAPELHCIGGVWYIYTTAAPPGVGNAGHRTLVLRSSRADPMEAAGWSFLGPVANLPDQWAIDATVFTLHGRLFMCWSGWPPGDRSDTQQDLFIQEMQSPESAMPGTEPVCISRAELAWERPEGGRRGVNEGPQWLSIAGFQGIVYSAHGSWTSDYKLGILALVGPDPLDRTHWTKRQTPLLVSDRAFGGPFGPGHASFVPSPWAAQGDQRIFCIYHATAHEGEGWANRKARVLPLDPACLAAHAPTVCCGMGLRPPIGLGHGHPGHPGPPPTANAETLMGGDKAWTGSRMRDKMPAEVRGIFDKLKRYV